jgi:translation initiation factor IF-1
MSTDTALEFDGVATQELRSAQFRVVLDNGHTLTAYTGGKLVRHRIRVLPGDRVRVALGAYDMTQGRITYRYNEGRT